VGFKQTATKEEIEKLQGEQSGMLNLAANGAKKPS